MAVLLSLAMVISMGTPVLAADNAPAKEEINYLCIGDSIAAGYGLDPSVYNTFPDNMKFSNSNLKSYGYLLNEYFKEGIGVQGVHTFNATQPGMRLEDFTAALELPDAPAIDDYNKMVVKKDWWGNEVEQPAYFDLRPFQQRKNDILAALDKADLITVNYGSNELFSYLRCSEELSGFFNGGGIGGAGGEDEQPEVPFSGIQGENLAILQELIGSSDTLSTVIKVLNESVCDFAQAWNALNDYLAAHNPDCQVVFMGTYNPMSMASLGLDTGNNGGNGGWNLAVQAKQAEEPKAKTTTEEKETLEVIKEALEESFEETAPQAEEFVEQQEKAIEQQEAIEQKEDAVEQEAVEQKEDAKEAAKDPTQAGIEDVLPRFNMQTMLDYLVDMVVNSLNNYIKNGTPRQFFKTNPNLQDPADVIAMMQLCFAGVVPASLYDSSKIRQTTANKYTAYSPASNVPRGTQQSKNVYFVDTSFLDINNVAEEDRAATYASDGVHPSVASHEILFNKIQETLQVRCSHENGTHEGVSKKATVSEDGSVDERCDFCGKAINNAGKISRIDVDTLNLSENSFVYDGKNKTPTITIQDADNHPLENGTDYDLSYSNNKKIGTASVIVTFKGKYSGTITENFTITEPQNEGYCRHSWKSSVTTKKATVDEDGEIETQCSECGKVFETRKIKRIDANSLKLSENSFIYDGKSKTPTVTIKDVDGKTLSNWTDYYAFCSDNVNVGKATVTITFNGNYSGTLTTTFEIIECPHESSRIKASKKATTEDDGAGVLTCDNCGAVLGNTTAIPRINAESLTLEQVEYVWKGINITPAVTIKDRTRKELSGETDYSVSYSNNKNVGTATVKVTFKGNYSGTLSKTFTIKENTCEHDYSQIVVTPATIEKDGSIATTCSKNCGAVKSVQTINRIGTITLSPTSFVADGLEKKPTVTIKDNGGWWQTKTLVAGTDYNLEYKDNVKVGTATVTITFKGNYAGTEDRTFTITCPHEKYSECVVPATKDADGYTEMLCDKCGTSKGEITPIKQIDASTINLLESSFVYDGSEKKPTVAIKDLDNHSLQSGTDYNLTYENSNGVGTATATITFKGKYSGTEKLNYTIICEHAITHIVNDRAATAFAEGYTGDEECVLCKTHLKDGKNIPKMVTKVRTAKLPCKVKQKFNAGSNLIIASGDSVKSVTTSNKKYASVSGTTVKGLKKGKTVTITVTMKSGAVVKYNVKVQSSAVKASSIKLSSASKLTLNKGSKSQVKVTKSAPITCKYGLKYSSSKKSVATVSSKGVITAKKKGTAKIYVKCKGAKTKTIKVTVK